MARNWLTAQGGGLTVGIRYPIQTIYRIDHFYEDFIENDQLNPPIAHLNLRLAKGWKTSNQQPVLFQRDRSSGVSRSQYIADFFNVFK
jgi:hypothetical protein